MTFNNHEVIYIHGMAVQGLSYNPKHILCAEAQTRVNNQVEGEVIFRQSIEYHLYRTHVYNEYCDLKAYLAVPYLALPAPQAEKVI